MISRRSVSGLLGSALLAAQSAVDSRWTILRRDRSTPVHEFAVSRDGIPFAITGPDEKPSLLTWQDTWQQHPLPETALSVFPLIEGYCWLAGVSGIWRSADGGKNWSQQWKGEGILRLYFLDEDRGYATGGNKTALFTNDGGQTWEPIAAAAEPRTTPEYTAYTWVEFVTTRVGIIAGTSRPPRSGITDVMPAWRDPAKASRRPEWPGASLTLETRDGSTWKHSSTSLFGRISRVKYGRDGRGLSLVEFHDVFEYPSEVFAINLRTGKSERAYREKDIAITDIALTQTGALGLLAGVEVPADPARDDTGRVHIMTSEDLRTWVDELLPERLMARRVFIAGFRTDSLWAATDTGVILRRKN
ncbi:MAG: hypothetical protein JNL98_11010 [Bryobacterales bacterium]|nr:hypothetical protein [Bryobacterales bacterium]